MRESLAIGAVTTLMMTLTLGARQTPGAPAGGPGRGQGRGVVISGPRDAYPSRPPADPAAVERGQAIYSVNCGFCHGADTRGGDNGPSLLRSSIVLDDQRGELIAPVVQNGRVDRGMPKFSLTDGQVADLSAYLHSFRAAGYDPSRNAPPSIVVGDARAGQTYFSATCASCHSVTGDLKGFASKIADPKTLQQTWLMPGSGGRGANPLPIPVPLTTVTVTLPSGEKSEGELQRLDDFAVSLIQQDSTFRSFRRNGDTPKVDVHDPLQAHKNMLPSYADSDIHNVTAYLVTLK